MNTPSHDGRFVMFGFGGLLFIAVIIATFLKGLTSAMACLTGVLLAGTCMFSIAIKQRPAGRHTVFVKRSEGFHNTLRLFYRIGWIGVIVVGLFKVGTPVGIIFGVFLGIHYLVVTTLGGEFLEFLYGPIPYIFQPWWQVWLKVLTLATITISGIISYFMFLEEGLMHNQLQGFAWFVSVVCFISLSIVPGFKRMHSLVTT